MAQKPYGCAQFLPEWQELEKNSPLMRRILTTSAERRYDLTHLSVEMAEMLKNAILGILGIS